VEDAGTSAIEDSWCDDGPQINVLDPSGEAWRHGGGQPSRQAPPNFVRAGAQEMLEGEEEGEVCEFVAQMDADGLDADGRAEAVMGAARQLLREAIPAVTCGSFLGTSNIGAVGWSGVAVTASFVVWWL
jgi:hypothetical protein